MPRALGHILCTPSIERGIRDLLTPDRNLIGFYLDEVTRQDTDLGQPVDRVERPRTVRIRERIARLADDQLPALIVTCPGTVGDPTRDGEGNYHATFSLGVTGITQSSDEDLGRELAAILAAAAAEVLIQCLPATDDRVVNVRFKGYASDDLDFSDDRRSRYVTTAGLEMDIQNVLNDHGQPPTDLLADPDLGDPALDAGDLLTVATTDLDVTPVETLNA